MNYLRFIALACLGSLVFLVFNAFLMLDRAPACEQFFLCSGSGHAQIALTSVPSRFASELPGQGHAERYSHIQNTDLQNNSRFAVAQTDNQTRENSQAGSSPLPGFLQDTSVVVLGLVASLIAGLATGVGALPVLFTAKISDRLQGSLLGFAAGVMLAATSFSLLIPSIERASAGGSGSVYAAGVAVGGTLLGSGFIWLADRNLPYQRFITAPDGSDYLKLKGIWLFILAIAVHNFPEGLAVGVGFGGGNIGNGLALAIGIGLQNMPEGLAVAFALLTQNYSKWTAFWIALATGLVEPVGGLFGVGILTLGEVLLPWGLAFAAGAMLFVIGDEVIPEAQHLEHGKIATASIVIGFVIMMFLDVALG
jgi:ZIP family zinc transporter